MGRVGRHDGDDGARHLGVGGAGRNDRTRPGAKGHGRCSLRCGREPATVSTTRCAPGLSLEEQKVQLVTIAKELFAGETTEGENRLKFDPDARDQRNGGIWLTLEFLGNEKGTVTQKKAALDSQMRDAFAALFNSGCDELAWVDMTAIHRAIVKVGQMGETTPVPSPVFKTRLKRADADSVDWANKDALDFNEIWDELLLNIRWRDALREEAGQ